MTPALRAWRKTLTSGAHIRYLAESLHRLRFVRNTCPARDGRPRGHGWDLMRPLTPPPLSSTSVVLFHMLAFTGATLIFRFSHLPSTAAAPRTLVVTHA